MFHTWLWALVLVVIAVAALVLVQSKLAARRWGTKAGPAVPIGEGAYRRGNTASEVLRGTPGPVTGFATVAAIWGVITLLVFVPAGFLLALISVEGNGSVPLMLFSILASLSGIGLGAALVTVATRLVRRSQGSIEQTLAVVRFSHAHHTAVWAGFFLAGVVMDPSGGGAYFLALTIPCGVGLLAGHGLGRAASQALSLQQIAIGPVAA